MYQHVVLSLFILLTLISCNEVKPLNQDGTSESIIKNEQEFVETLEKHLQAVSDKDLETLKSTLSPSGKMQLILPGMEMLNSVEAFMDYHKKWFEIDPWTFDTKIIDTEIGSQYGFAITEILYKEPVRDGKPYFNRMIVSYDLQKIEGQWYIIKDHASSIEKSTDEKNASHDHEHDGHNHE